ncbi:MAG: hypothetical protein M1817_006563 [Caeruleum heppii]|nr:MAG: hypothetical protein M1817_006563 [Caeruleum heppii]
MAVIVDLDMLYSVRYVLTLALLLPFSSALNARNVSNDASNITTPITLDPTVLPSSSILADTAVVAEVNTTIPFPVTTEVDEPVVASPNPTVLTLTDNSNPGPNLAVPLPVVPQDDAAVVPKSNPTEAAAAAVAGIASALPTVLAQLGVPQDQVNAKVQEDVTVFNDVLLTLFGEGDVTDVEPTNRRLRRRGLFSKIGKVIGDITNPILDPLKSAVKTNTCAIFTAGTTAGFLGYANAWRSLNPGGVPTSQDQNFFLHPVHGSIYRTGNLKVHYNAKKPFGFRDVDGVTFAKHIYIPGSFQPYRDTGVAYLTSAFRDQVRLMIHEVTHCRQYRAVGWQYADFAVKYLTSYCEVGFSYRRISLEDEAYREDVSADALLENTEGQKFFLAWRSQNLFAELGYPIAKTYTNRGNGLTDLLFQEGALQLRDNCFRTFTRAEIIIRAKSSCTDNGAACQQAKTQWREIASNRALDCVLPF